MENSDQILKNKPSKIKTLLGGLFAIGIAASLLILGSIDLKTAENLKTALPEANTPAITSLTPTLGKVGDLIYLTVENLENFSEEEIEVLFGEELAKINAFDEISNNNPFSNLLSDTTTTIVVEVPQLMETRSYPVQIITPNGTIESTEQFELTDEMEMGVEPTTPESPFATPETEVGIPTEENSKPVENFYTPATTEILISPPQNLQAASTANGIELSWEKPANGDAAFYNIYYGAKSDSYIHRVISDNTYEIFSENLASGQHYFFAVSAIDTNGNESGGSNETSAIYSPSASAKLALTKVGAATSIFHAASPKPSQLSEEGPTAALLISIFATFGISIFIFRKKIFIR